MPVDDSYTVALLHMDGTDASTTFTDESGKSWTANGNAQIDTAQSKFGGASGLFDGTTDYITAADSVDWYFAANPFTIDFWYRPTSTTAYDTFIGQHVDANNLWKFDLGATANHPRFVIVSGGVVKADYSTTDAQTFTNGTWYHLALVRDGTNVYIMKDGTSLALTAATSISTNEVPNLATGLVFGYDSVNAGRDIDGWADELRVSKGIARWTAGFTPSTVPYGNSTGFFHFF
jgi:hypothetical protein